jgi:hypothetical protein
LAVSDISHSVTVAMSTAEEMRRFINASSLPELRSLLAFQVIRTRGFLSWFGGERVTSLAESAATLAESAASLAESTVLLAKSAASLAEPTVSLAKSAASLAESTASLFPIAASW